VRSIDKCRTEPEATRQRMHTNQADSTFAAVDLQVAGEIAARLSGIHNHQHDVSPTCAALSNPGGVQLGAALA
jgi:hypothetical protein